MARFSLNIETCCLYVIWESKIKFGQTFLHPQKDALPYTYEHARWLLQNTTSLYQQSRSSQRYYTLTRKSEMQLKRW